jgi:8-oxo-dGTP pyrophosphatase MutT (NUDIX family)
MIVAVSAKAVLLNPENQILALRRTPESKNRPGQWDLPGGKADLDETPEQAGVREIGEETGLTVAIGDLEKLYQTTDLCDDGTVRRRFYYISRVSAGEVICSPEHDIDRWMELAEAAQAFEHPPHLDLIKFVIAQQAAKPAN